MKKFFIIAGVLLAFVIGTVFYLANSREKPCLTCEKNRNDKNTQEIKFADYFQNESDLCNILTKETVSNLLRKTVMKTNPITTSTSHSCEYYITDSEAVSINYDTLNVENQKQGHKFLDRKIVTNPKIPMNHFLIIQENGLINEIYLVLGENEYVSINRTSTKTIGEDGVINFAAKLAEIVSGIIPLGKTETKNESSKGSVPLPQEEDIVQNFFTLIDKKKPAEAVGMMLVTDDSQKQTWAVQFNAMDSVKVLKIEPSMQEEWSNTKHTYKVTLEVKMKPDSASAPIPYYGWDAEQNIRWVSLEKNGDLWEIAEIATGP